MIQPHKFMDINHSILNISGLILKTLRTGPGLITYDQLFKEIESLADKEKMKYVFPLALNFLFIIGKIEYYKLTDKFRLVQ